MALVDGVCWRHAGLALALLSALALYGLAVSRLSGARPQSVAPELVVTLPRLAQVAFSAGDRYLAANLTGFRVLVASTDRMRRDDFAVQARLQQDIAWLSPAHEDNYYIAAALLPWSGEVSAAQEVLRRAADARPFDWQPLFYYGFNLYHFYNDPRRGAAALLEAVPRAAGDQSDQWSLQALAAIWTERGYEAGTAAKLVDGMATTAPPGAFRKYLGVRAERLHMLVRLKDAAREYQSRHGRPPQRLQDLVEGGLIDQLPTDPLGQGFTLSAQGEPVFLGRNP